jgi:hypothetical protein
MTKLRSFWNCIFLSKFYYNEKSIVESGSTAGAIIAHAIACSMGKPGTFPL